MKLKDITIVTPYSAQVELIKKRLRGAYPNLSDGALEGTEGKDTLPAVTTIDGVQGGQNRAVIIDFVRSNNMKQIGFLKDLRRLNVALSRAQDFLSVVWDKDTMTGGPGPNESADDKAARAKLNGIEEFWDKEVKPFFYPEELEEGVEEEVPEIPPEVPPVPVLPAKADYMQVKEPFYSVDSMKDDKALTFANADEAKAFGEKLVVAGKAHKLPVMVEGRTFDIIIEHNTCVSAEAVRAALSEVISRTKDIGGDINRLPSTLVFGLLDTSSHLFEDHIANGFIGINKAVSLIKDPAVRDAIVLTGLYHELSHEATGTAGGQFEAAQSARDAVFMAQTLLKKNISASQLEQAVKGLLDDVFIDFAAKVHSHVVDGWTVILLVRETLAKQWPGSLHSYSALETMAPEAKMRLMQDIYSITAGQFREWGLGDILDPAKTPIYGGDYREALAAAFPGFALQRDLFGTIEVPAEREKSALVKEIEGTRDEKMRYSLEKVRSIIEAVGKVRPATLDDLQKWAASGNHALKEVLVKTVAGRVLFVIGNGYLTLCYYDPTTPLDYPPGSVSAPYLGVDAELKPGLSRTVFLSDGFHRYLDAKVREMMRTSVTESKGTDPVLQVKVVRRSDDMITCEALMTKGEPMFQRLRVIRDGNGAMVDLMRSGGTTDRMVAIRPKQLKAPAGKPAPAQEPAEEKTVLREMLIGEREEGGTLVAEFVGPFWVKAGLYYYKFWVEGDELKGQRYFEKKAADSTVISKRLGDMFTVGNIKLENDINTVKDSALRHHHFTVRVVRLWEGRIAFRIDDLKTKRGTLIQWDEPKELAGLWKDGERTVEDVGAGATPGESLTPQERFDLVSAIGRARQTGMSEEIAARFPEFPRGVTVVLVSDTPVVLDGLFVLGASGRTAKCVRIGKIVYLASYDYAADDIRHEFAEITARDRLMASLRKQNPHIEAGGAYDSDTVVFAGREMFYGEAVRDIERAAHFAGLLAEESGRWARPGGAGMPQRILVAIASSGDPAYARRLIDNTQKAVREIESNPFHPDREAAVRMVRSVEAAARSALAAMAVKGSPDEEAAARAHLKEKGVNVDHLESEFSGLIAMCGYLPFTEICDSAGEHAYYLFRHGLPVVKGMIQDRGSLMKTGGDLVRIGKAAGNREGWHFLYTEALPAARALFSEKDFRRYWPRLVRFARSAGEESVQLFRDVLPAVKRILGERNFREFIGVSSLNAGNEAMTAVALVRLEQLLRQYPSSWRRTIRPIIFDQHAATFQCLGEIKKLYDLGAIASEDDLAFLRAFIEKSGPRAYDLLAHFIVVGVEKGIIAKPLSKERETVGRFMKECPYSIIEIFDAYKADPAKVPALVARCDEIRRRITAGDASNVDADPLFGAVLIDTFPPAVFAERSNYLAVYRGRLDRAGDTRRIRGSVQRSDLEFGDRGLKLRCVVSKRKAHAVAGFNMGVCVASDEKLWNDRNFMNVILFDEQGIAQGGMHVMVVDEEDGKKYLTLPGINPSVGLLSRVPAKEVVGKLLAYAQALAWELGCDAVLIPERADIHSNRPEVRQAIADEDFGKVHLAKQHLFSHAPEYSFQDCFLVPASAAEEAVPPARVVTAEYLQVNEPYYSKDPMKDGAAVNFANADEAKAFGEKLCAAGKADMYKQIDVLGRNFDIIVEKGAGFNAEMVRAMISEAVNRTKDAGGDINKLPATLVFSILDRSSHLFEDHIDNGFVGINRALYEIKDDKVRNLLLQVGLMHELSHEATGKAGHEFEKAQLYRDAAFAAEKLVDLGVTAGKFREQLMRIALPDAAVLADLAGRYTRGVITHVPPTSGLQAAAGRLFDRVLDLLLWPISTRLRLDTRERAIVMRILDVFDQACGLGISEEQKRDIAARKVSYVSVSRLSMLEKIFFAGMGLYSLKQAIWFGRIVSILGMAATPFGLRILSNTAAYAFAGIFSFWFVVAVDLRGVIGFVHGIADRVFMSDMILSEKTTMDGDLAHAIGHEIAHQLNLPNHALLAEAYASIASYAVDPENTKHGEKAYYCLYGVMADAVMAVEQDPAVRAAMARKFFRSPRIHNGFNDCNTPEEKAAYMRKVRDRLTAEDLRSPVYITDAFTPWVYEYAEVIGYMHARTAPTLVDAMRQVAELGRQQEQGTAVGFLRKFTRAGGITGAAPAITPVRASRRYTYPAGGFDVRVSNPNNNYAKTSAGAVSIGMSMLQRLLFPDKGDYPSIIIAPRYTWTGDDGSNLMQLYFSIACNFNEHKRKTKIVCTPEQKQRIIAYLQAANPDYLPNPSGYLSEEELRQFRREAVYLADRSVIDGTLRMVSPLDMVDFVEFDASGTALIGALSIGDRGDGTFALTDRGRAEVVLDGRQMKELDAEFLNVTPLDEIPEFGATFLGTSSGMDPNGLSSNQIVWAGGRHILIDIGAATIPALKALGVSPADITDVMITHLHEDHVAGALAYFAWCSKNAHPIRLLIEPGMYALFKEQAKQILGREIEDVYRIKAVSLKFRQPVMLDDVLIETVPAFHGTPTAMARITCQGKTISLSSDTAFDPKRFDEISRNANASNIKADLVLHADVEKPVIDGERVHELTGFLVKQNEAGNKPSVIIHEGGVAAPADANATNHTTPYALQQLPAADQKNIWVNHSPNLPDDAAFAFRHAAPLSTVTVMPPSVRTYRPSVEEEVETIGRCEPSA
ncbi:MAG TPA: AAA domain-containing protein [bacterium]|nr:AAA domain-containing protein [bacterium]